MAAEASALEVDQAKPTSQPSFLQESQFGSLGTGRSRTIDATVVSLPLVAQALVA